MNNIVYLKDFAKSIVKIDNNSNQTKANVVQEFFDSFVADYASLLEKYKVQVSDDELAFDLASVQFFVKGMAHRMVGETHPSHIILNNMRKSVTGS